MHPDNKILISAILILGIALVSFNISGLSGQVSKEDCTPIGIEVRQIDPWLEATVTMDKNPQGLLINGIPPGSQMITYKETGGRIGDVKVNRDAIKELDKTGETTIKTYNNDEKIQCVSLYDRCLSGWTPLECLS